MYIYMQLKCGGLRSVLVFASKKSLRQMSPSRCDESPYIGEHIQGVRIEESLRGLATKYIFQDYQDCARTKYKPTVYIIFMHMLY